jgi:glycosyltransferase involved in cell wall biosynthesis
MISVVIASYNGEKYIKEQIESILVQISHDDEVIISDDGSTDNTVEVVKQMMISDSRIKLIAGPKAGFNKNFENAIKHANGDYIFIADQDDVWMKNKVSRIIDEFNKNEKIMCIRHDCRVVDLSGNVIISSYNKYRKSNVSYKKNILKNTFTGCCMCVKAEWLKKLLPFPDKIFYDAWIGILSCKYKNVKIIDDKLIDWRRHDGTVTNAKKRNSIIWILKDRMNIIKNLKRKCKTL